MRYFIATKLEKIEYAWGKQRKVYFVFKVPGKGSCTINFNERCIGEMGNIEDEIQIPIIKAKGYMIESFFKEEEILLI